MNTEQKSRIIAILGDASLFLSIFAGLPYAFGDVADAFGPEVKKWVSISSLFLAAISKAVQRAIEMLTRSTSNPGSPLGTEPPLPVVVTNTNADPVHTEEANPNHLGGRAPLPMPPPPPPQPSSAGGSQPYRGPLIP